jgi:hypothetical protein
MELYELGLRGYKMFYIDNRKKDERLRVAGIYSLRTHKNLIEIFIHTCLSGQFS